MRSTSRSPIKDKPLRTPGQSLEEQRRALIEDKVVEPLIVVVFLVVLTALEWYRYLTVAPLTPMLFSAVSALAIAYAAWRIRKIRPEARALSQAIAGEKAVGQFLDGLRESGYRVFHDVLGDGFNVDHVLIGPGGIFTIETKTWSKPGRGEAKVYFDGDNLRAGSLEPDRNPIIQARAQAGWVRDLLAESTARKFEVHPVILFPGWFIESAPGSLQRVWVLNPKALAEFLAREPLCLAEDDIKLASFHLSRFIRSSEVEREKR